MSRAIEIKEYIVQEGTSNTESSNYIEYFDTDHKDYEFIKENIDEIEKLLCADERVLDLEIEIEDDVIIFDVIYGIIFCPNYYLNAEEREKYDNMFGQLKEKAKENIWLMSEEDYPTWDYKFVYEQFNTIEQLKEFFNKGNWAIRQTVLFYDLAFIQQVNGGDEWWTLKYENEKWIAFESVSFQPMIERGNKEFQKYIKNIYELTTSEYWKENNLFQNTIEIENVNEDEEDMEL